MASNDWIVCAPRFYQNDKENQQIPQLIIKAFVSLPQNIIFELLQRRVINIPQIKIYPSTLSRRAFVKCE